MEKQFVQFQNGTVVGVTQYPDGALEFDRDNVLLARVSVPVTTEAAEPTVDSL